MFNISRVDLGCVSEGVAGGSIAAVVAAAITRGYRLLVVVSKKQKILTFVPFCPHVSSHVYRKQLVDKLLKFREGLENDA